MGAYVPGPEEAVAVVTVLVVWLLIYAIGWVVVFCYHRLVRWVMRRFYGREE